MEGPRVSGNTPVRTRASGRTDRAGRSGLGWQRHVEKPGLQTRNGPEHLDDQGRRVQDVRLHPVHAPQVLPVTAVASQQELARTSARASATVFDHVHESGFDLVSVAEPLIAVSLERLRMGLARLNGAGSQVPIDPTTIEDILFTDVPRQLFALLGRTMVLELNVARVEGRLEGSTSEDRFQSFV